MDKIKTNMIIPNPTLDRDSNSILIKATEYYYKILTGVFGDNFGKRLVVALIISIILNLTVYYIVGYIQFSILEQPIISYTIENPVFKLFGYNTITTKYYDVAEILIFILYSLALSFPAFFICILIILFNLKKAIAESKPISRFAVSGLINTIVAFIPFIIGFYTTYYYYTYDTLWMSDNFVRKEIEGFYIGEYTIFILVILSSNILWALFLIFSFLFKTASILLTTLISIIKLLYQTRRQDSKEFIKAIKQPEAQDNKLIDDVLPATDINLFDSIKAAWNRFFGFDFFISYAWEGGSSYAHALQSILSEKNYRCFIDFKEMRTGQAWRRSVFKALKRSSVLLFVGSDKALETDAVFQEIKQFSYSGRPIVPIDFEDNVANLEEKHRLWPFLEQQLRCADPGGKVVLNTGKVSSEVINYCDDSFNFIRISRIRSMILGLIAIIMAGLSLVAIERYYAESKARYATNAQFMASTALTEMERSPEQALLFTNEAIKRTRAPISLRSLYQTLYRWPNLKCIQRTTFNSPKAMSDWDSSPLTMIDSGLVHRFPNLCTPREFRPWKLFDGPQEVPVSATTVVYNSKNETFLIGNDIGKISLYHVRERRHQNVASVRGDAVEAISLLDANGDWFFYSNQVDRGNTPIEVCLMNTSGSRKSCIEFPDLISGIKQILPDKTNQRILVLSIGSIYSVKYRKVENDYEIVHDSVKPFSIPVKSPDLLALSHHGEYLAIADSDTVNLVSFNYKHTFPPNTKKDSYVSALAFSNNDQYLAIARGKAGVDIIDPGNGDILHHVDSLDKEWIRSVKFSRDDTRLMVLSSKGLIAVWGLSAENPLSSRRISGDDILAVAPNPKGGFFLLTSSNAGNECIEQEDITIVPIESSMYNLAKQDILALKSSDNGKIITIATDKKLLVRTKCSEWRIMEIGLEEDERIELLDVSGDSAWVIRTIMILSGLQFYMISGKSVSLEIF